MASFETTSYWKEFYEEFDEDELYDWYSSCQWLSENIQARFESLQAGQLSVIDIGCGNSPLLFDLAQSDKFAELVGVDFAKEAIERCNKHTETLDVEIKSKLSLHVGDGRKLNEVVAKKQFDIVIDKGCLDCFVSGGGENDILIYFQELASILKPDGTLFLVPVNGADIPHLLRTGEIILDKRASGRLDPKVVETWEKLKSRQQLSEKLYEQQLFLHEVIGRDEKHLFVCKKNRREEGEVDSIICDMCLEFYSYPSGFPAQCGQCLNRIQRFALS